VYRSGTWVQVNKVEQGKYRTSGVIQGYRRSRGVHETYRVIGAVQGYRSITDVQKK